MDYLLNLLPEKPKKVFKTAELVCERCGETFTVPFWVLKKGRRFCKQSCRKQNPLTTLLSRVKIQDNGCWNYTGLIGWGGYGQIKVGTTSYSAHKLMWMVWNEQKVPDGLVIRHTCIGNPRCINPDHLTPGTQKQNIQDAIAQGRFHLPKGKRRANAKLTHDMVRKIRSLRGPSERKPECKYSYKDIADMIGISRAAVRQVVTLQTWNNVV